MAGTVSLLRHASPPKNRVARHWGRADRGVVPGELRKVSVLAPLFQGRPERPLTSPTRRAAATADEPAACFGLAAETAPPRFRDENCGGGISRRYRFHRK